jgi:hypothetical protein
MSKTTKADAVKAAEAEGCDPRVLTLPVSRWPVPSQERYAAGRVLTGEPGDPFSVEEAERHD